MKALKFQLALGILLFLCLPLMCLAAGSISGHVENNSTERIQGALVSAVQNDTIEGSYITDTNGEYVIVDLDAGTYDLHVDASGYEFTVEFGVVVTNTNNTTANILNIAVEGKITGTIKESDGTTVIENVAVNADYGMGYFFTAFTDPNGVYTIENLPEATYTVTAQDPNYIFSSDVSVGVVSGETDSNINFTGYNGIISGTITESNGTTPVEDALVLAYEDPNNILATDFTDSNGDYELTYFNTGSYDIDVRFDGATVASSEDVSVTDGQTTDEDFSLEGGSISGTVKNSSQTAIEGVILSVAANGSLLQAVSDSNGSYKIEKLPAGTFTVTVDPNSTNYKAEKNEDVVVSDDTETQNINFVLSSSVGKITGTVVDSSQNPVEGASVIAIDADPNSLNDPNVAFIGSETDENGDYTIDYLHSSSTYLVSVYADGYVNQAEPNVVVTIGQTTSDIDFTLQDASSGGKISGTVYQSNGTTPISGAIVLCLSLETTSDAQILTASDGTYTLDSLQAGTYEVHSMASGYELETLTGITVTAGNENSGNDFTLELE